jgi:RNA polymerase sigma-70 factor (ECF subfamily)
MTSTEQVSEFESLRPQLLAVAYRLTGAVTDAEDIVQEAWLRWDAAEAPDQIVDLRAWLTTVVSRLALDRLRSAAHRRERYVGQWLPEPVVTGFGDGDPLSIVVAHEDARYAAMVVLERLSPDQRIAFVLHDGFAVPFADVADVLGTTAAAARQLASRARQAVAEEPPPVQVIHGPDKVARFMFGLAQRYGPAFFTATQLARINGELGGYTVGNPAEGEYRQMMPRILAVTVRDGKVCALWDIANPDKFTGSPLKSDPPTPDLRPTEYGTRHRN